MVCVFAQSSCRENDKPICSTRWGLLWENMQNNKGSCWKKQFYKANPQLPGAAASAYFYKAVTKYFPDRTENNLPNFTCLSLEKAIGGYQKKHLVLLKSFFLLVKSSGGKIVSFCSLIHPLWFYFADFFMKLFGHVVSFSFSLCSSPSRKSRPRRIQKPNWLACHPTGFWKHLETLSCRLLCSCPMHREVNQ